MISTKTNILIRSIELRNLILCRNLNIVKTAEYLDKPSYPEILDNSTECKKVRKNKKWHEEIQNLKTVEEKIIKVNLPRYYGYKCVMIGDQKIPYNCLPLTQHYTRTQFEVVKNIPSFYDHNETIVDVLSKNIKSDIIDAIEFCTDFFKCKYEDIKMSEEIKDKKLGELIVNQVNRVLINLLCSDYPHLSEICVDIEPRHEAFWWVGGVNPTNNLRKTNSSVDRVVQYLGSPYLALRHPLPLNSVSINSENSEIPLYPFDARTIGYSTTHRHGTNIPGFWPGSPHEFGILSYQKRNYIVQQKLNFNAEDKQEALHAQGIQSSFAWLFAQACYQGFSSFNDVTYPLNTQTIVTNGKFWSFYVYNLNTTLIHSNNPIDNPKINKCWGSLELKLFEGFDENSKCVGFNLDVLKNIINFYINKPAERLYNMKPYLGENEKIVADIKDEDRRLFLDRIFKHLSSNRPRHLLIPEIYTWEKIYKIDHNTRPLEAKKRFFERGINPFARKLDQHTPAYIPKKLRHDGNKSKKRWEKQYYP